MASLSISPGAQCAKRIPLAKIDALVTAHLGPTRSVENFHHVCFNRQVAMYLASRLGRWSTTVIGRYYNGRDHSTVCHAIQKIEALRESEPEVDALLSRLKHFLSSTEAGMGQMEPVQSLTRSIQSVLSAEQLEALADLIVERLAQDKAGAD